MKRGLLAVALLAILAATLTPDQGDATAGISACIVCGDRAASDILLNLILFLPLGAALGLLVPRGLRVLMVPLVLSAAIEFAQLFIPGRDPSVGDVIFNTAGATLGIVLARTAPAWLAPRPAMRPPLAALATILAMGVWVATAFLGRPSLPRSAWFGQWTPSLERLEWYRARVHGVTLGPLPLPATRLDRSEEARSRLLAGEPLRIRAIAGPRTPALGPLFSIADDSSREIALVGPDRDDLVFRYRMRAADLTLDQPDLRLRGAMRSIAAGDTLAVDVWREGGAWCLRLNGERACGLRLGIGRAWSFLMYPEGLPPWFMTLLDHAWIAGLMLPLGLWGRGRVLAAAAAVMTAGALLVPGWTGLATVAPSGFLAMATGLGIGAWLRIMVARGIPTGAFVARGQPSW